MNSPNNKELESMKIKNARHLNSKELYERRKQAVMLYRKGMKRREIAPIVGAAAYRQVNG